MVFDTLYNIVDKEISSKSRLEKLNTKKIHSRLIRNDEVRNILEIEKPIVENISDELELSNGSVYAVRLDKAYGITGFKKPVAGALILKKLIESVRVKEYNKKWIDGGNVNSALALTYFANKFEGDVSFIMSRFFPEYVLDYIKNISKNRIELIQSPNLALGIERDFYQYLLNLIRMDSNFKNYQPLWHAKYSGEYTTFLGEELLNCLDSAPDYIVLVIGAGSILEGQAIPIKWKYNGMPKIVIPEHCESRLLSNKVLNLPTKNKGEQTINSNWFSNPPTGIPHYVIGPHFDEVNPLLKRKVLNEIDFVYSYNEYEWKEMSLRCYSNNLAVGNSSAANLFVSKQLAVKGKKVLTFIYEPFREFYVGHNLSFINERITSHSSICP